MANDGSRAGAVIGGLAGAYFGGAQGAQAGVGIGSAFGGLFDEGEGNANQPLGIYDQMRQNYEWQKEFAQNGITWRVQDAKNAGLHPLFALGGGGAAFAPSGIAVEPDRGAYSGIDHGQNLASALARVETPEQREARQLGLAEVKSRIAENDARAAYYDAMAMKAYQESLGQPGLPSPQTLLGDSGGGGAGGSGITMHSRLQHAPGNTDAILLKPNEQVSSVEGRTWQGAGLKPMWERADFGVLGKWFVPRTDDFWETWGELSWYDKLMVLGASMLQENQTRMPAPRVPDPRDVFERGYYGGRYQPPSRLMPYPKNAGQPYWRK